MPGSGLRSPRPSLRVESRSPFGAESVAGRSRQRFRAVSFPMHRRFRPPWRCRIALTSVVAVCLAARAWTLSRGTDGPSFLREGDYQVGQVVSGNELRLTNDAVIRLRGVALPENRVPAAAADRLATAATRFTRMFVASEAVRLEFDPERVDAQGTFMAYVYVNERSLNEALVRAGWACFDPRQRCMAFRRRRLLQAQQAAMESGRGMWAGGGEQLVMPSRDP